MSETNGNRFSKANLLTIGGLALLAGGVLGTVSITWGFANSQSNFRDEMRTANSVLKEQITASNTAVKEQIQAVKDDIGKNVQATKDEQQRAVQSVKDEVRDRSAELATRIGDIKQKLEIADLKLVDRWTATDMRRLWADMARAWLEAKRRNPALDWPDLPEVK